MSTHGQRRYDVLSAAFVSKATTPGHYHDGHGLILRVTRAGTKQWVQRLRIRGKRRELRLGGDPLAEKRQARGVPTFAEAARKGLRAPVRRLAQRQARRTVDHDAGTVRVPADRRARRR